MKTLDEMINEQMENFTHVSDSMSKRVGELAVTLAEVMESIGVWGIRIDDKRVVKRKSYDDIYPGYKFLAINYTGSNVDHLLAIKDKGGKWEPVNGFTDDDYFDIYEASKSTQFIFLKSFGALFAKLEKRAKEIEEEINKSREYDN